MNTEGTASVEYGYYDRPDLQEALYHVDDEVYRKHRIYYGDTTGNFTLSAVYTQVTAPIGKGASVSLDPALTNPAMLKMYDKKFAAFFKELGISWPGPPCLFVSVSVDG